MEWLQFLGHHRSGEVELEAECVRGTKPRWQLVHLHVGHCKSGSRGESEKLKYIRDYSALAFKAFRVYLNFAGLCHTSNQWILISRLVVTTWTSTVQPLMLTMFSGLAMMEAGTWATSKHVSEKNARSNQMEDTGTGTRERSEANKSKIQPTIHWSDQR